MSVFEQEWMRINGNIFNLDHIIHIHLNGNVVEMVHVEGSCRMQFDNPEAAALGFEEIHNHLKNK